MYEATSDISDTYLEGVKRMCARLGCRPLDALGCWMNESGVRSYAQNKSALAAGFFQAMPMTLRGMGFRGDSTYQEATGAYAIARHALEVAKATENAIALAAAQRELRNLDQELSNAFLRIGLEGQLGWAERYYAPHSGKLVDGAACYAANFVPAWISHAAEPEWMICSAVPSKWRGRSDGGLKPGESDEWYQENRNLDADGDGAITMGDLARVILRAQQGPRWAELAARVNELELAPDTLPEPVALAGEPALDVDLSGAPDVPSAG